MLSLLALVVVLGAAWFVHSLSAERNAAQARWERQEPSAYAFVYGHCSGMCASCPVHVTVRGGTVTEATVREPGCGTPALEFVPTIEDVFTVAEDHQPWPFSDSTTIDYDPVWGFPRSITHTCGEDTADCGSGWSVRDFEVIG